MNISHMMVNIFADLGEQKEKASSVMLAETKTRKLAPFPGCYVNLTLLGR